MYLVSFRSLSGIPGEVIMVAASVSEAACEFLRRSPAYVVVGYPVAVSLS